MIRIGNLGLYPKLKMSHEPLVITFIKQKNKLLNIAGNFLGNREDASDVVQEVFCRLWPIKDRIKTENEAASMAVKTAKNICIDRLRREDSLYFSKLDKTQDIGSGEYIQQNFETRETFLIVRQIINEHLSVLQRQILEMKDFEGYEIEEISQKLNMQPTAVRMNLSRARKEIRDQYNRIVHEDRYNG